MKKKKFPAAKGIGSKKSSLKSKLRDRSPKATPSDIS